MHPVTRRTTVGFGACAAIFRLLPICHLNAQTAVSDELYSRFLSWSRTATGFADIPAAAARSFLELSFRSGITHDQLSALDPGSYRGTPIERRLLEAWYTGVFKIGSAETRATRRP